jgi:hypothetical protein
VWTGELKVEKELNQEFTTAFPIMEAVPAMRPGIYLLAAQPGNVAGNDYGERTTQWFIVSDLGLTAYSGTDGIHAYINSLATTAPLEGVEIRLLARNNEVLAVKQTDAGGAVAFEPGLARGEGGLSPALIIASGDGGDYAFLNLKQSAFDLTDRGVAGRDVPQGLDAFVFTERGVYRTGETVYVTTLLRDAAGIAVPGVDLTMVVERPMGWSIAAPSCRIRDWRPLARRADHLLGADRNLARRRLFRPERSLDRGSDLPGRRLRAGSVGVRPHHQGHPHLAKCPCRSPARRPLPLWRAGSRPQHRRRGEYRQGRRAAGLPGLFLRPRRRE